MLRVAAGQSQLRLWSVLVLRWLLMLGVPIALIVLESRHPSGFDDDVYGGLGPMAGDWLRIHLLQLPLFGLIGIAALNLTWGLEGFWPWLSRVAVWFFLIFYTAMDAIAGLAVGTILSHQTAGMDTRTVAAIVQFLFRDPVVGGVGSVISVAGSFGWLIAIFAAIIAIVMANGTRPWWMRLVPSMLLAVCGVVLLENHANPYGPIAFFCFASASLWFEIFRFGPAASANEEWVAAPR
jgi:hypothetical protein